MRPPMGPREGRGDVAIPPTCGPPRRQGLSSHSSVTKEAEVRMLCTSGTSVQEVPLGNVWTDKSNSATRHDEGEDEVEVCALCCYFRSNVTVCGECQEL